MGGKTSSGIEVVDFSRVMYHPRVMNNLVEYSDSIVENKNLTIILQNYNTRIFREKYAVV